MQKTTLNSANRLLCASLALAAMANSQAQSVSASSTRPQLGLTETEISRVAITGADAWIGPGKWLKNATVLIADGKILSLRANGAVPAGFQELAVPGKQLLPGFIDLDGAIGLSAKTCPTPKPKAAAHWNASVCPDFAHQSLLKLVAEDFKTYRSQGFTTVLTQLPSGIWRGQSALLSLQPEPSPENSVLKANVAQSVAMQRNQGFSAGYPTSSMGAIALIRQSLYDARWQAEQRANQARVEYNPALDALLPVLNGAQPLMFHTQDELELSRALKIAKEFNLEPILLGTGVEFRRLDDLRGAAIKGIVLPIDFPQAPAVENPELALDISLAQLETWNDAPHNPALLSKAGINFALSASGGKESAKNFSGNLAKALKHGLSRDQAIAALTTVPARLIGMQDSLGSLQENALANLLIVDARWPEQSAESLHEVWVAGTRVPLFDQRQRALLGRWQVALPGAAAPKELKIQLKGDGLAVSATGFPPVISDGKTANPSKPGAATKTAEPTKLAEPGDSVEVVSRYEQQRLVLYVPGAWLGANTVSEAVIVTRSGENLALSWQPAHGASQDQNFRAPALACDECARSQEAPAEGGKSEAPRTLSATRYPAGEFGRAQLPAQENVVFRGATVWMAGAEPLSNTDVLIKNGKIQAIGQALVASGVREIDASELHLSPGLIDAHSHIAVSGDVNEGSHTISAEVRIADVLDPTDINIYRQLAGGLTTAHVLHGSANTIGGQSQVIKLRWGQAAEALKFQQAWPTIKFALGENPKQSNWGEAFTTRYPQTRMGVEQLLLDSFLNAQRYSAQRADSKRTSRVDLRMAGIAEVVDGTRKIHVHSYRQDEIQMFARLTQRFDIKIAAFQHVLEGYKVANLLQEIGAGASTFSDWWAFKPEAHDAIPQNATMLMRAGVVTSLNSDSPDTARRLNTEAAKLIRFGGLSETEALSLITTMPAKQLGVDQLVGSIEVGKQADLVLWTANPLSTRARVLQTWIEGARYFDQADDLVLRTSNLERRSALVALALSERIKDKMSLKPEPPAQKTGEAANQVSAIETGSGMPSTPANLSSVPLPRDLWFSRPRAWSAELDPHASPYHNGEPVHVCTGGH